MKEICFLVREEVTVRSADDRGLRRSEECLESGVAGEINTVRVFQPDQVR